MGKIRINTIGDESLEQKQKTQAEKRREAKKMEKNQDISPANDEESQRFSQANGLIGRTESVLPQKKIVQKKSSAKKKKRSPRYIASQKIIDKSKLYTISDALDALSQIQKTKFDE